MFYTFQFSNSLIRRQKANNGTPSERNRFFLDIKTFEVWLKKTFNYIIFVCNCLRGATEAWCPTRVSDGITCHCSTVSILMKMMSIFNALNRLLHTEASRKLHGLLNIIWSRMKVMKMMGWAELFSCPGDFKHSKLCGKELLECDINEQLFMLESFKTQNW